MPSHSSNASPMPFPFLPVVIDSPQTASARHAESSATASDALLRAGAGRSKSRAAPRSGVDAAATPPGMTPDARNALRVEVVRSVAPGCLTLLGAIIR